MQNLRNLNAKCINYFQNNKINNYKFSKGNIKDTIKYKNNI